MSDHAIAQLRHLYAQMVGGHVKNAPGAARGLLGPAIEELERALASLRSLAHKDAGRIATMEAALDKIAHQLERTEPSLCMMRAAIERWRRA